MLGVIQCFVGRHDIFTQLSLAPAMIVKVIVELVSTLVLVTEELKQRQPIESSPFLLAHYLTSTQRNAAQTPGVVHCLVESMKEFMDDEKTHLVCNPVSVESISL